MSYQIKYRRPTRKEIRERRLKEKEHNLLVHEIDQLSKGMSKEEMLKICPQCDYGQFPDIDKVTNELIDVWKLVDIKLPIEKLKALLEDLKKMLQLEVKEDLVLA